MLEYIEITHSGATVSLEVFADINSIGIEATGEDLFTLEMLLNYEGNLDRIRISLRPEEQVTSIADAVVKSGVIIRVPKDRVTREIIATSGNLLVPNESFEAFLDDRIKEIIGDTDYRPLNIEELRTDLGVAFRFVNDFSVWVWCKALGTSGENGRLINITPFVESLTTNVGENGGNFSIKLSPAIGKIDSVNGGKWAVDESTAMQYAYNDKKNIVVRSGDSYYARGTNDTDERIQRLYLFHNIIQSNDVVFIKFEPLASDVDKRKTEAGALNLDTFLVDPSSLVDGSSVGQRQLFDMIGLIDNNSQTRNNGAADTSISIAGRDLMKLLLEDGEYFYPSDIAGVTGGIQGEKKGRAIQRLVSGDFNFFTAYTERTIEFTMRFVLYMLSNIKVCDASIFGHYGDIRTNRYAFAKDIDTTTPTEELKQELVEGIWQIVKLVIDPKIQDRRIVDSSIVSDQGSLKSFIDGKIIQKPFVEFYGDTYGNQYYFIARKPPYNKESYISNAKLAVDIREEDIYSENLTWNDEDVYSWYRIIPRGNFFGDDESMALTYFPAVFLEEYAEIWGSRPYQFISNYIDYQGIRGDKNKVNLDFLTEQAYQDLSFVIQSYCYLPFSRKGSIAIKGDRRIKRGNMIRHRGTGELFHVDAVSNSVSVNEGGTDRVTNLVVSRGLKEKFVNGSDVFIPKGNDPTVGEYKRISYFDIVKMDLDQNGVPKTRDFKVDKGVFNFFLRRMQVGTHQGSANSTTY